MIRITIETEDGFSAESLRQLANELESSDLLDLAYEDAKPEIHCGDKYTAAIEYTECETVTLMS